MVSMAVKTTRSPAMKLPVSVMACPTLAEARPALAGVPLAAAAVIASRPIVPAAWRSTLRLYAPW